MRAVRLSFIQMLACMRRDRMLSAACLAPVLIGFLFRFAIPYLEIILTEWLDRPAILSPCYILIDLLFTMLSPAMFCFVSAMVSLEEADEKTAIYLFITPLGKAGYLSARLGIPAAAAFIITVILLPVFKLTSLSLIDVLLFAAAGTLQGVIVALLILTFSSNKLEGMAISKLSTLTILGAAIPFFIKNNIQYLFCFLPSFWIGKTAYENRLFYIFPALVLSAVWICFLLKYYLCKMRK